VRQVVLDTETTGLDVAQGHRVIEIGCVELLGRRPTGHNFHRYLNPQRAVDEGALAVHGIGNDFLADKPTFSAIARELLDYLGDAEILAHNAAFDVGFLDAEFALAGSPVRIASRWHVLDTLALAREKYPGQRNSLDALCKRLGVDAGRRELHGALLDAQLLAEVYLSMTAGQGDLGLVAAESAPTATTAVTAAADLRAIRIRILRADAFEELAHAARLDTIERASGHAPLWRRAEEADPGPG
jgi:DNA polymerase-3 subunit epsilon